MSVLIKDMEIPETCDDCPFHVYHSHYEYVCKATPMFYPMNLANTKGIRKEWCPLSEVSSAQPEIIYCKKCKHWTETCGDKQWGLGDCDVFDKHLVMCNGYCAWAERREE